MTFSILELTKTLYPIDILGPYDSLLDALEDFFATYYSTEAAFAHLYVETGEVLLVYSYETKLFQSSP